MKKEINQGKGEIIWKDSNKLDFISLVIALFFFIFSVFFVFNSQPRSDNALYKIFLLPIVLFTAFLLYTQIRKKRTLVRSGGVRVGNLIHWADDKLIIKQKPTFFKWSEIKEINILLKSYRQGIYTGRDFYHVHLKPVQGRVYDCLIHNPEGFIRALKKLNKTDLLDKKTKEKFK